MIELTPIEASRPHHDDRTPVTPASAKEFSYVWVTRAKKSHPWQAVAVCYVAGDVCQAAAEKYFTAQGYVSADHSLAKLVDGRTWRQFQVTQHLKAVGIKRTR